MKKERLYEMAVLLNRPAIPQLFKSKAQFLAVRLYLSASCCHHQHSFKHVKIRQQQPRIYRAEKQTVRRCYVKL